MTPELLPVEQSPMLPQPRDVVDRGSDAPMISGPHTWQIVSAKQAYRAKDLDALIAVLNDDQQERFRAALVQQAIDLARRYSEFRTTGNALVILDAADDWLREPTRENAEIMLESLVAGGYLRDHGWNGTSYYVPLEVDHAAPLFAVLEAITSESATGALEAITTVRNYGEYRLTLPDELRQAYPTQHHVEHLHHSWRVEAAWAVFRGDTIPTLEAHRLNIARRAYRTHDLLHLLTLMDFEQMYQFHNIVIDEAIRHVERAIPPTEVYAPEARCLAQVREWHHNATENQARYGHGRESPHTLVDTSDDPVRLAVRYLTMAVQMWHWIEDVALLTRLAIEHALIAQGSERWANPRRAIRQWHLDAAWAILQGSAPPSLNG